MMVFFTTVSRSAVFLVIVNSTDQTERPFNGSETLCGHFGLIS